MTLSKTPRGNDIYSGDRLHELLKGAKGHKPHDLSPAKNEKSGDHEASGTGKEGANKGYF